MKVSHPVIKAFNEANRQSPYRVKLNNNGQLSVERKGDILLLDTANGARILNFKQEGRPVINGYDVASTHLSLGLIAKQRTSAIQQILRAAESIQHPTLRKFVSLYYSRMIAPKHNILATILNQLPDHGGVRNKPTTLTDISQTGADSVNIKLTQAGEEQLGLLSPYFESINYIFGVSPQGLTYTTEIKASEHNRGNMEVPVLHHLYPAVRDTINHPPKIQFLDHAGDMLVLNETDSFHRLSGIGKEDIVAWPGGLAAPFDKLMFTNSNKAIITDAHAGQKIILESSMAHRLTETAQDIWTWQGWNARGNEKYQEAAKTHIAIEPRALAETLRPGQSLSHTTTISSQALN